jgi:hypothetical protein
MKNIIAIIALLALCAAPAVADNWTFDFEMVGDVSKVVMYHKVMPDPMPTAQKFVDGGDFVGIELPAVSPQTFVIDYADGVKYGMYAVAFDANGDSSIVMGDDGAPLVWVATAVPEIMPARYITVEPVMKEHLLRILNFLMGQ